MDVTIFMYIVCRKSDWSCLNDSGVKVEDINICSPKCDSPSLIEIYSSRDLKVRLFYNLIGGKMGHLYSEIIHVGYVTLYQMSQIYFNIKAGRRGKGGRSALWVIEILPAKSYLHLIKCICAVIVPWVDFNARTQNSYHQWNVHNQAFIGKSTHNCRSIKVPLAFCCSNVPV
jgi:hypothetical protein